MISPLARAEIARELKRYREYKIFERIDERNNGVLWCITSILALSLSLKVFPQEVFDLRTSTPELSTWLRCSTSRTAALDGETDLKTRMISSACIGLAPELLHKIKILLLQDQFTKNFSKSVFLEKAGNETKLGMSRGIPEPKLTAVDAMIDKLTGAIFLFQIVVVIVLGIAGNVWKDTEARKQWYVLYPSEGPWYELLVIPLRFELLCSIMIPISIKLGRLPDPTRAEVKVVQA
ncbi:Phospholipid-transporting ATPase 2 [Acorus gramineus]|uniref:Phospholipid-transporting ATPase 2 n=1 Tax=Acorus gramineus TaxID=55184 RepID=A0AAV9A772_ACOGR|nr:Phospholipid-transporting ATPase 2 [Acorus gramineus]